MHKKLLIISLSLIGLIAGGMVYLALSGSSTVRDEMITFETRKPAERGTETSGPQTGASATTPGAYVPYSDTAFTKASGTRLLFFYAPWCPECRALDASIKTGSVPSGVTILNVDFDSSQQLRKRYGVTMQTTVVRVDAAGNLVGKYVAYDEPSLASVEKNLL